MKKAQDNMIRVRIPVSGKYRIYGSESLDNALIVIDEFESDERPTLAAMKKKYEKDGDAMKVRVVQRVETTKATYEIDREKFMEHAVKVEDDKED